MGTLAKRVDLTSHNGLCALSAINKHCIIWLRTLNIESLCYLGLLGLASWPNNNERASEMKCINKIIRLLILVFINIAVTLSILCILELVLRATNLVPKINVRPMYYSNLIGDYEPSISVLNQFPEIHPYRFTTNNQGVRSLRPISWKKEDATIRILCLGDSFTMGWGVDDQSTYPEYLYHDMIKKYPNLRFDVINAGAIFSNILDQLDYYLEKGQHLNPDVVILQFYLNDISSEMSRAYVDRLANRTASGKVFSNKLFSYNWLQATAIYNLASLMHYYLAKKTCFNDRSDNVAQTNQADVSKYLTTPSDNQQSILNKTDELLDVDNLHIIRSIFDSYGKALLELKQKVESNNGLFIFMIIPCKEQMFIYKNSPSCYFSEYAKKYGLNVFDLTTVFRNSINKDYTELYLTNDDHANVKGNALIAKAISEALDVRRDPSLKVSFTPPLAPSSAGCGRAYSLHLVPAVSGLVLADGQNLRPFSLTEVKNSNLVRDNPGPHLYYIRNNFQEHDSGNALLHVVTRQPVSRVDLTFCARLLNDAKGLSRITVSFSRDGQAFQPLYSRFSDVSEVWDDEFRFKIINLAFPEKHTDFFFKFDFDHYAGLLTQDGPKPMREVVVTFYP